MERIPKEITTEMLENELKLRKEENELGLKEKEEEVYCVWDIVEGSYGFVYIICPVMAGSSTLILVSPVSYCCLSNNPFKVEDRDRIKASELPVKVKRLSGKFVYQESK